MSLIAGVLAALVAGPATAQQGPAALKPVQLLPGLTYERQVQFTSHGPVAVNLLPAPRAGATEAVLSPFPPPTTASTDIQGPVVQVKQNGKTPIPAGGAVLSSRGPAAAQALTAEAQVGQAITVRPILQPDWLAITDAVGGGPLLVRNGAPVFRALEDF